MALKKQEMGNVLIVGNSGVGKSTLINAVLGEEVAETGWGSKGSTRELSIKESSDKKVPFRLIDTVGFEPSFLKQRAAINAVKKWSKDCAKEGKEDNTINVIWFCVDGTSAKLFPEAIHNLSQATSMWKSVPVIAVITKSYSVPDREKNIEMVTAAFAGQTRYRKNIKKIIPVVAQPFFITEEAFAPPQGIEELIAATNECMPEGIKAGMSDLTRFILKRKKALSRSVVAAATGAGVAVAAIPFNFADAAMLGPIELAEIEAIAKIYNVRKDDKSKKFIDTLVDAGTVGAVAKGLVSGVKRLAKQLPVVKVANAVVAGGIVASLGEIAIYAFEQIYLGNRSLDELEWLKKLTETFLKDGLSSKLESIADSVKDAGDLKAVGKVVFDYIEKLVAEISASDRPNIRR